MCGLVTRIIKNPLRWRNGGEYEKYDKHKVDKGDKGDKGDTGTSTGTVSPPVTQYVPVDNRVTKGYSSHVRHYGVTLAQCKDICNGIPVPYTPLTLPTIGSV